MKRLFLIVTLMATNALAQDILPKPPSGPKIKQDAFENYEWAKKAQSDTLGAMVNSYKIGDYKNALNKALVLAEKNDPDAMALAGYIYEMGLGLPTPDYQSAVKYYRSAMKLGSHDAMIGLGRIASIGEGKIPLLEATTALETAIAAKRADAVMPMADLLVRSGSDPDRALALYEGLAAAGDGQAAYRAAVLLDDGSPLPADNPQMAFGYLKQAANADIAAAQADLGLYYYLGKVTPKDLMAAANWFKKSAENGDKQGQFYWALVNAKGEGVVKNLDTASQYADLARDEIPQAQRLYDQIQKIKSAPAPK